MKKVIITIPRAKEEKLEKSLAGIVFTRVEFEEWTRYTLYVQDGMVDEMINKTHASLNGEGPKSTGAPIWTGLIPEIHEAAGEEDRYTLIEVSTPDFVISPYLDKLKQEWKAHAPREERTPVEKILATIEDSTTFDKNKVILAAIAGIVALIGLFLNNVGIIIGGMLLSPLLGPIYALAISVATGNRTGTIDCVKILAVYIVMLIAIAALVTLPLSHLVDLQMTPEIASRMDANSVYIVMAILLGIATIIALAKGIPEGIAGVAFAAVLLPPAVVAGIALVWHPAGFLGALTLTLQNVVGLVAGSLIGVVFLKIGPRDLFLHYQAKKSLAHIAWVLLALIVLLAGISFLI